MTLTIQQAADQVGVHYDTLWRAVMGGRLPAEWVAGAWCIAPADLEKFQATHSLKKGKPRATEKARQHSLCFREAEWEALQQAASAQGLTVSRYLWHLHATK